MESDTVPVSKGKRDFCSGDGFVGCLKQPRDEMIISIQEPWMVLDVADDKISVLIYTGAITLP